MKRIAHTPLPVTAKSHPGMSGKNNEDRFAVSAYELEDSYQTPSLLAVLADGIGGHRAGEVAAEIAVNQISEWIASSDASQPLAILQDAIHSASQQIQMDAAVDSGRTGMGATCAVVWLVGGRMYTGTVGDSRIYLMRGGTIQQVSTDHTWIQDALERGLLKPEQARGHPNAHVIRRYLGSPTPPEVDFRLRMAGLEGDNQALSNQGSFMLPGDRMLLCSDGLTDLVEAEEILHYFQSLPREEAVDALIRLANERGGHDNITLVAIESPMPQAKPKKKFPTRLVVVGCLSMFIVFLAVMGLLAGGLLIRSVLEPTPTVPVGAPTLSLPQIATPLENRLFKTATATPEVSTPTLRPTQSQAPVNGTPQPVSTSLPVPNQAVPEPTATVQLPILLK